MFYWLFTCIYLLFEPNPSVWVALRLNVLRPNAALSVVEFNVTKLFVFLQSSKCTTHPNKLWTCFDFNSNAVTLCSILQSSHKQKTWTVRSHTSSYKTVQFLVCLRFCTVYREYTNPNNYWGILRYNVILLIKMKLTCSLPFFFNRIFQFFW